MQSAIPNSVSWYEPELRAMLQKDIASRLRWVDSYAICTNEGSVRVSAYGRLHMVSLIAHGYWPGKLTIGEDSTRLSWHLELHGKMSNSQAYFNICPKGPCKQPNTAYLVCCILHDCCERGLLRNAKSVKRHQM